MVGGVEQLGFLIRRNLAPIQGRIHRELIAQELQAVKVQPTLGGFPSILRLQAIRRNLAPIHGRIHRELIAQELQAVRITL